MTARILNGNAIRDKIYAELKQEIAALVSGGIRPVWPEVGGLTECAYAPAAELLRYATHNRGPLFCLNRLSSISRCSPNCAMPEWIFCAA